MSEELKRKDQKKTKRLKKKKSTKASAADNAETEQVKQVTGGASDTTTTSVNSPPGVEETLFWCHTGSDEKSQVLEVLRLQVLSPFLFSQQLLCDQAFSLCVEHKLLLEKNRKLRQFFERRQWPMVMELAQVMAAVVKACENEDSVYQSTVMGSGAMTQAEVVQSLKKNGLGEIRADVLLSIISCQGRDLVARAKSSPTVLVVFLENLKEKSRFAEAIKARADNNFKLKNFKAALADYNKAVTLCPYSAVLYYNRALCLLYQQEHWHTAVDSLRALFLYPSWEKPYWTCAEAWHNLKNSTVAIEINHRGKRLASSDVYLRSQLKYIADKGGKSRDSRAATASSESVEETKTKSSSISSKKKASKDSSNSEVEKKRAKVTPSNSDHDKKHGKEATSSVETDKKSKSSDGSKRSITELEELHCPQVHPSLTCSELRKLCHQVKLDWCSPAAYFSAAGSKWEGLESEWVPPASPSTDPTAEREPMLAKFDEIWCPALADSGEPFVPPTFQYFSDGAIMHATAY